MYTTCKLIMSLIDKFYEVFPEHMVLKILSFKPHDTALLIKDDIEDIGYKYADMYSRLFEYNRLIYKGRKKAMQRKYEMDEKLKLAYIERRELVNKILRQQMLCRESSSCRTLLSKHLNTCDCCDDILQYCDDAINCSHYEEIKKIQNNTRNCNFKIKDFEIESVAVNNNVTIFLNMKIEDVYNISDIM